MESSYLKLLIVEYRKIKSKLEEIQRKYDYPKILSQIKNDLEKELESEIRWAKEADDKEKENFWKNIFDNYYHKDENLKVKEIKLDKVDQMLIAYYQKKLKVIKKLLGARITQILENYEEKSILTTNQLTDDES